MEFVLIDGEHTKSGLMRDIENVLAHVPRSRPLYILMHDSFNPECRAGIRAADWQGNPHVHFVEVDFVGGVMVDFAEMRGEMWGGMALAVLLPQPRTQELQIRASQNLLFETARARAVSPNRPDRLLTRLRWRMERMQRRKT